jgi:elongation factor G
VADLALMLINTSNGVEAGTESAARHAESKHTPMMFVFNALDHDNANFDSAIDQIKGSFGNKVTIVQYPVETGPGFDSIIDVLKMKLYKYSKDGGQLKSWKFRHQKRIKLKSCKTPLLKWLQKMKNP